MDIELFKELEFDTWIGGDYKEFEFTVKDQDNPLDPVDLTTFLEIRWILFRYGDSENPLLNLLGHVVAEDNSKFDVYIDSEYTKDISGLFLHQPVLIDSSGREFRPAQGGINIIPRGQGQNSQIIQNNNTNKNIFNIY